MLVTVFPEPPKMATPESKPETVPPSTVTPVAMTRRIPAWSPGRFLPVTLNPLRSRVTLEAVTTRPSVPVQGPTLAVRVVLWVMCVPQSRTAALAGPAVTSPVTTSEAAAPAVARVVRSLMCSFVFVV